ncbi:MAG: DegT/DnrJ/EryC1/StrS family aminotransferase [Candidatus Omnitrophica bacterium]|nr:DegT/DnrJ/EryC1/StrS family aminotransferase [Candidatus Omnitrophota bacterium]
MKAYPRHSVDITGKEYGIIASLLCSAAMVRGEYIPLFERQFAEYINVRYAAAIPSARLGLYLLFKYYNFPADTQVIITPFTHQSIFTVIKAFGFKPVFADIDPVTYNVSPQTVERHITPRTKVLILTHMWGQPCEMEGFMRLKKQYGLTVIEDCAMACGAAYADKPAGSFGDAAIFSFGKAKSISTFGGGMLCTGDADIHAFVRKFSETFHDAGRGRLTIQIVNSLLANILTRPRIFFWTLYPVLRFFNIRDPYNPMEHKKDSSAILDAVPEDWKVRMSNLQAAVGIEQLKNLDRHNQARMDNARILNRILGDIPGIRIPRALPQARHTYLYYALCVEKSVDLNELRKKLIASRIDSQLNELTTPQQLTVFGGDCAAFPEFARIAGNLLIIPNGIYLNEPDIRFIGQSCGKIFQASAVGKK